MNLNYFYRLIKLKLFIAHFVSRIVPKMSSDRLMATSYRFETNKGYSNTRRLAQEAKIEVLLS